MIFGGINETLDDTDEVINVDQELNAEPDDIVRTNLEAVYLAGTEETCSAEVDLYDLGTTRHLSGFRHHFINYVNTEPSQHQNLVSPRQTLIYVMCPWDHDI